MKNHEFNESLRKFRECCEKRFSEMTDQELVDAHNSATNHRGFGWYVAAYINARKMVLKKRFPDTTTIIFKTRYGDEVYSLRNCGAWIAWINGVKTLACSELDEQPPTKKHVTDNIQEKGGNPP
jgi:hypothetical protein